VGDGSGSVITNPATQLEHWLTNFVWNEHKGTANWYSSSGLPIDASTWTSTKTWFDDLGFKGSRRIGGTQPKGMDVIGEFADEWLLKFFWTGTGKLGVLPQDLRTYSIYASDPWVRQAAGHEIGRSFQINDDPVDIRDRISIKHCRLEAQGLFAQALEIRDPELNEQAAETAELDWSPSYVV
jgi:hypothetical protein